MARWVCFAFLLFALELRADLIPPDLQFTLRSIDTLCCSPNRLVLELEIQNLSNNRGSIIVPGHPTKGFHLFDVLVYERVEDQGQWMLRETLPVHGGLLADSHRYEQFWNLDPGEVFKQLFVLDRPATSNLSYQICYAPQRSALYPHVFCDVDPEGVLVDPNVDSTEKFKSQGAFYSPLIQSSPQVSPQGLSGRTARAVERGNWRRLERQLRHKMPRLSGWPVLSDQLYSQAVLASLPTYWHQYLVVETHAGIQSIGLTYRIGKIYPVRSFLARMAHLMGARRVFWRTSSSSSLRLMELTVVDPKNNQ